MEKSWEEQRERSVRISEDLKAYGEDLAAADSEGWFYNPSAAEFTGWVKIPEENEKAAELRTSAGKIQVSGKEPGKMRIFDEPACYLEQVPPLSSVKAVPAEKEPEALEVKKEGALSSAENHRYRLDFDEIIGKITRLYDKKLRKTLLEERNGEGVFQYRYTRHGIQKMTEFLRSYGYRFLTWGVQDYGRENYPECEDESFVPAFAGLEIQGSTLKFTYRSDRSAELYGDAKEIGLDVTLPPKGNELFVEIRLKDKQETPYLESGMISMPLAGADQYWLNKNGSLLDPAKDIRRAANHVYYPLENFAAAEKENTGVMVLTEDAPLLSIGEDGCYRYRKEWEEKDPVFCFNLFNNMWGTNFPQWTGGDFSFRFIIAGYEIKEREKLYERSELLRSGLLLTDRPAPALGLKLPERMELLNLKKEGEGKLILVTRDLSGKGSREKLKFPGYDLIEIDGYGRKTGETAADVLDFDRRCFGLHLFLAEVR